MRFYYTLPRESLEAGIELLAQSVRDPLLDPTQLEKEIKVVLSEFDLHDGNYDDVQLLDLPSYSEIHVVSVLHMGGSPAAFQILRETKRFAGFIGWVARQQPSQPVALVLNGDVIDTLAENVSGYIAVDDAVDVVKRIIEDVSFAPVWEALSAFVKMPNRKLVLCSATTTLSLPCRRCSV